MSEPTLQELKELIISQNQSLELKISGLDKKVETGLIEMKGEIKRVEQTLTAEIKRVEQTLTAEIKQVEATLKGEIRTVDAKLEGLDKRLSNEEAISRTVFGGLILAVCVGVIKYLFFSPA